MLLIVSLLWRAGEKEFVEYYLNSNQRAGFKNIEPVCGGETYYASCHEVDVNDIAVGLGCWHGDKIYRDSERQLKIAKERKKIARENDITAINRVES